MSLILAFSCLHLATPDIAEYLHGAAEYPLDELVRLAYKADIVISLGDFSEPLYCEPEQLRLLFKDFITGLASNSKQLVMLNGNHEKYGHPYSEWFPTAYHGDSFEKDGYKFVHGHQGYPNVASRSDRNEYVKTIRDHFSQSNTIYGHTHEPMVGAGFMDVGSVTYSRTVGWCKDGNLSIERL